MKNEQDREREMEMLKAQTLGIAAFGIAMAIMGFVVMGFCLFGAIASLL